MKQKSGRAWVIRSAALLLLAVAGAASAQAAGGADDVARGKRLFMLCAACHDVKSGGPARIGPHLDGLFGRTSASVPGFQYSAAMKAKPFVWDEKALDAWLVKPSDVVPGNAMPFAGMPQAADRKAIAAYLKSVK